MNFYKRHIGDYLKDTAHLSLLEHGVYTRLLDVYYTRESGIPDAQSARLIGARGKEELAALKVVLDEFFELIDGTWVQHRCEREIHSAAKPEDQEQGEKSGKAARQQRYRDRRKAMFDRLREHGVAMPYDASMDDLQDALLRVTVTSPVTPETRNVTATISHKPDSITTTTPHTPQGGRNATDDEKAEKPKRSAVGLLTYLQSCKQSGKKPIAEGDAVFAYADQVGIPLEYLRLHWLEFKARYGLPDAKRYKDWPAVHRKSVRGNWFRLWFIDAQGNVMLTTVGEQAKRVHGEAA